ncbi:MAG: cation-translocating P-type ATPase [Bacillota bacterium]
MTEWHSANLGAVLNTLGSNPDSGLSTHQVDKRLIEYGPNTLKERGPKSPWRILWEQLTAVMIIVLIIAAAASVFLHDYKDAAAILTIVILNAVLGFVQEYRAEKAMAALKRLATPAVKVRRNGEVQEISAVGLVPGDIFFLEVGGIVPADGRLLEAVNLRVQESVLTGESLPVEKNASFLSEDDLTLGDRLNMVYKGTVVTYGRGIVVTTATGMDTELGRIAEMIQAVEAESTPLQRRMAALGRTLGIIAIVIVAVVVTLGLLRGEDLKTMFLTGVSLAVAAVPEGLPAAVTIALALGAQRMLRRRALIRKLPAVETLGLVTKICSDKTGTLTENRMVVTTLALPAEEAPGRIRDIDLPAEGQVLPDELLSPIALGLLTAGALCNDALLSFNEKEDRHSYIGDPTEGALVVAAARTGMQKADLETFMPRVAEIPFTSERKRMTTIHRMIENRSKALSYVYPWQSESFVSFSKGATGSILEICEKVWVDGSAQPMNKNRRDWIVEANNRLSGSGLRVLGVAFRNLGSLPATAQEEEIERDFIFLGLIGMMDPPRQEAKEAVAVCRRSGIDPVMITGDHPLTALAIARELGITEKQKVITGQELEKLTPGELTEMVEDAAVYARVSPEHKLKIVEAFKLKGHVVAMTGDGVNDAPALKKADIGIAMGITGTDVSKEAADMVLLDDNFATIVAAAEEGRVIYDNIRKFLKYLMTTNFGEILVLFVGMLTAMPVPLAPLQILWINLVTDGLPALALAVEPAEREAMNRPPPDTKKGIFADGLGVHILWVGALMAVVSLGLGYWAWQANNNTWQTMLFTTLALSQLGHVMAIRTGKVSLFKAGILSNKPMFGAVVLTVALQITVIYVPWFRDIFGTVPLTAVEMLICFILGSVVFWMVETEKWFLRLSDARLR